jgi:flagellar motility protein MotE (MotC chaperone)
MDKLKDLIIVAIVGILSFPIIVIAILLINGTVRLEYGPVKKVIEEEKKIEMIKQSNKKDSIYQANSKLFTATQLEKEELEKERKRLQDVEIRLNELKKEIEEKKISIELDRKSIEKIVESKDTLRGKKIKTVAKIYTSMKPAEAAQILEVMPDKDAADIMSAINDDRQKAKIMEAFSTDKAARMTSMLGGKK